MSDSLIQGAGAHRYEWIDQWAVMPAGKAFGDTHAVCEVADGRIFVHNGSVDSVAIFSPEGEFLDSWGEEYAQGAHGMQLNVEDGVEYLYLAVTSQNFIAKTTLDGEVIFKLGYPEASGLYESAEQYVPTNIAIAPNGDFYVADGYGLSYVHHYNAQGDYLKSFGGTGDGVGQLDCPHGIWCDMRSGEAELVVADRRNVRLQYFSLEGEHLRFVNDGFLFPDHFDQQGNDLLVPDLHGRVTILDGNNDVITHLFENPGVQDRSDYPNLPHADRIPGKFISPHGACWDRAGNIFVGEWIPDGRVTKLKRVRD